MNIWEYLDNRKRRIDKKEIVIDEHISPPCSPKLVKRIFRNDMDEIENQNFKNKRSLIETLSEDENEDLKHDANDSIDLFSTSSQESGIKTPKHLNELVIDDEDELCPETPPSQLRMYGMEISESPLMTPRRNIKDPDLSELIEYPSDDNEVDVNIVERTPPRRKKQARKKALKPVGYGLELTSRLRKAQADLNFWKAEKSDEIMQTTSSSYKQLSKNANEHLFTIDNCISSWGVSLLETNNPNTFIATKAFNYASSETIVFMKEPMYAFEIGEPPLQSKQIIVGAKLIRQ